MIGVADHQPLGERGFIEASVCREKDQGRKLGGSQVLVKNYCRRQMNGINAAQRMFFKKVAGGLQQRLGDRRQPIEAMKMLYELSNGLVKLCRREVPFPVATGKGAPQFNPQEVRTQYGDRRLVQQQAVQPVGAGLGYIELNRGTAVKVVMAHIRSARSSMMRSDREHPTLSLRDKTCFSWGDNGLKSAGSGSDGARRPA